MSSSDKFAPKVAEFLLKIKAVQLRPSEPFTWASGWNSPIYCDNRKTLSYPAVREFIRSAFCKTILDRFGMPDSIAGVATGGIALGALVADELGIPFVYVRSASKGHGLGNRIEGVLESGQKVVVIEDLISTGKSSLSAIEALREVGADIMGLVAIFSYGFQAAEDNFSDANCPYFTLSDYDTLIDKAIENSYVESAELETLRNWRKSPSTWKPALV